MKLIKKIGIILFIFASSIMLVSLSGCKKGQKATGKVKLKFTSIKHENTVSRPLPILVKGEITNYDNLKGKGIHIYLIEQSLKEGKKWHIEPKCKLTGDGKWQGPTWLGNKKQGNKSTFNLCVFASSKVIKLRNGNHPVWKKPANIGENCIKVKRVD
ncbi:hypothetical protein ACFL20_07520 [Spirochaetota bacterium]